MSTRRAHAHKLKFQLPGPLPGSWQLPSIFFSCEQVLAAKNRGGVSIYGHPPVVVCRCRDSDCFTGTGIGGNYYPVSYQLLVGPQVAVFIVSGVNSVNNLLTSSITGTGTSIGWIPARVIEIFPPDGRTDVPVILVTEPGGTV